jgi:hypothetical protein
MWTSQSNLKIRSSRMPYRKYDDKGKIDGYDWAKLGIHVAIVAIGCATSVGAYTYLTLPEGPCKDEVIDGGSCSHPDATITECSTYNFICTCPPKPSKKKIPAKK